MNHAASRERAAQVGSRELLERVAASRQFQKSKRLRDLLLYLGDRGLNDPGCTLREQEVGVDVLGRPPDYDTSHDTLVRVLISHLRKKLHEHFGAEGRDEPVIIEIPKGSYVPVFRQRPNDFPGLQPTLRKHLPTLLFGMLAGMSLMGLAWFAWSAMQSKRERGAGRPNVEEFWGQVLANGQATF